MLTICRNFINLLPRANYILAVTTLAQKAWEEANTPGMESESDPPSYGQASIDAREHKPVSMRTKKSWVPRSIHNSRLGVNGTPTVKWNILLQRQLSSGSVKSGSIRSDIMTRPPPLPPWLLQQFKLVMGGKQCEKWAYKE